MQQSARRHRALAPANDAVRHGFENALADRLEAESWDLLDPGETLHRGAGHEIIPRVRDDRAGVGSVLSEPNLLGLQASTQRTDLIERAGVLELAIETAEDIQATGAVQKMLAHQMAACHRRALTLLAESERAPTAELACLKAKVAARLIDAFSRAALAVQRLPQVIETEDITVQTHSVQTRSTRRATE